MHRQATPKSRPEPEFKPKPRGAVQTRPAKVRRRWSTAVLGVVAASGVCLGLWLGFALRGIRDQDAALRVAAGSDAATAEDLVKHYASFEEYAEEMFGRLSGGGAGGAGSSSSGRSSSSSSSSSERNKPLPVPIVTAPGGGVEDSMIIPLATIIGVQKGGTQSLRNHLKTHPLLGGVHGAETHFFDRGPRWYPKAGAWPGDGKEEQLSPEVAGFVLREYAKASMQTVKSNATDCTVTVESSPKYIFNTLAPYRMKMVQPHARLVLVLRDPTERYFSHLRMVMCSGKRNRSFEEIEEGQGAWFHAPGGAAGYIKRGEASYEPYTPLCRGEKATSNDLLECYKAQLQYHPLLRGLYADQLERWFRVYDRSQILIVDSSEMMFDIPGVLAKVSDHIGLPGHSFKIVRPVQHSSGAGCPGLNRGDDPDFFGKSGR